MAILSFSSPSRCGCIDEKKFYSSQKKSLNIKMLTAILNKTVETK